MTASTSVSTHKFESRVIDSVRRIFRALEVHSSRLENEHGITGSQLMCLRVIADGDATTATAISRRIHLSASTVVGILDRLEGKGLIERARDVRDRRVVNVAATRSGRRLAGKAPSLLHELAGSLIDEPAAERERVAGALETIAGRIDRLIGLEGGVDSVEKRGR